MAAWLQHSKQPGSTFYFVLSESHPETARSAFPSQMGSRSTQPWTRSCFSSHFTQTGPRICGRIYSVGRLLWLCFLLFANIFS